MKLPRLLWMTRLVLSAGLLAMTGQSLRADEPAPVRFNRDIRPILSDKCFVCHGYDENERQSGLRLDTEEGLTALLDSGERAVVPGKSGDSALYERISAEDPHLRMPPADSGKTLSAAEIDLIKRWIDQGAVWEGHWAFIPPERPEPPAVQHEPAVRNPIDRFILARLEQEGLKPSDEADKVTLIRRVTYDLTGLPPTPAEVDAFLADGSADAYEKLVERLLKSARYGEHMGRYWLDAARYGDTHGLHLDNERSIWPYRNWVIQAFNDNLPFDRFTIEQLAGDLLPEPTTDQLVATGFNRCHVTTSEGGSIAEEVLFRNLVDRVETTSTVFMGLTMGCAVCHDHKFDPISQKEFYQLYAFFNRSADPPLDGNALSPGPTVKLPTPEQTAEMQRLDEGLARVRKQVVDELAKIEYVDPGAEAGTATAEPREYVWIEDELPPKANPQGNTSWEFVSGPDHPVFSGQKSHRRKAQGLSQHFFTGADPGLKIGEGDVLFAYVWLDPADPPKEIMLQFNDGSWEHRAYWGEDVIPWGAAGTPARLPMGPLPEAGQWVRLEVEARKVGLAPGAVLNGWAFTQHDGTVYWDKAGSVTRTPQAEQSFESQLAWEAYEKGQSKSELPQPVQQALKVEPDQRNDDQQKLLRNHFLENVYAKTRPLFEPLHKELAALEQNKKNLEAAIPVTLIMQDQPQPRDTHLLVRGAYDKKGEQVTEGVPAVLPPLPEDAPRNRLTLAQWLVDPGHPLTARVTVNRFWQQFLGTGLVNTPEDFGAQGQWPTHPELLDWLATEFVASGWDVRQMVRLIVTSGTYRQSSRVTPDLLQRDPDNELLARGPRFRMDAEMIRDTALYTSGLLVERPAGKSVKPYQPDGLWEAVAFTSSNTRTFKRDDGDALYRRSLYTFWKRTSPPPSMTTFDAPSRETCTIRRPRTNTPLQALALMNDEQYVEAARHFAERMMTEGGGPLEDRIGWGFRTATARVPSDTERAVLARIYQEQLAEYQGDNEAAVKLLSVGESKRNESLDPAEHAAWTMIANLLLNLDETVTKE